MGAMAMLSLLLTTASSAQAESSWCLNKGGTGSTNCGYYSYQQCMASGSTEAVVIAQHRFGDAIKMEQVTARVDRRSPRKCVLPHLWILLVMRP
jgi:hypothetical protein